MVLVLRSLASHAFTANDREESRRREKHCPNAPPKDSAYRPSRGMQNHGLTMFRSACYIKKVPRVHPRLVVCCGFLCCGVCREFAVKLKKEELVVSGWK